MKTNLLTNPDFELPACLLIFQKKGLVVTIFCYHLQLHYYNQVKPAFWHWLKM